MKDQSELVERAIATFVDRLAAEDEHLGRAFVCWLRRSYAGQRMPKRLADYFERNMPPSDIPSCVLCSYGAVAQRYLECPHAPKGLRVQGDRLERVRDELQRRLSRLGG
ncbi:MAG: hypothetical protein AAGD14_09510 [Planctomycetota bacterium]